MEVSGDGGEDFGGEIEEGQGREGWQGHRECGSRELAARAVWMGVPVVGMLAGRADTGRCVGFSAQYIDCSGSLHGQQRQQLRRRWASRYVTREGAYAETNWALSGHGPLTVILQARFTSEPHVSRPETRSAS